MKITKKELLLKATSNGFITMDEIRELYPDDEKKREKLISELKKNEIQIISLEEPEIDMSTDADVLPEPIKEEEEKPAPKKKAKKQETEDPLDLDSDEDSDELDDAYDPYLDDEQEEDAEEEEEELLEEEKEESLDEIDDAEFYQDAQSDDSEQYAYDNFDDLIYSQSAQKNGPKIMVSDSVKMYLKEIGRIDLLTPEKEQEVAKVIFETQEEKKEYLEKINNGYKPTPEEEAEYKKRQMEGDYAKKVLTEANLRLVVNIAKHFNNPDMEFPDLIQEGSIGLSKAVIKFDYRRGNKFSTYATGWIKQAITRAIADQARTIRIPVHMNETINKLNKKERELTHELGRKPTYEELANAMGITIDKLMMIKRISQKTKSLEDPVGEEDDSSYGDFVPDSDNPNPEEYTANEALKKEINTLLSNLSDREEKVIKMRFGLEDGRTKTLEEVGKEFGVTRERIRQIEAKALRKLRHPSRSNKLKDFLK